ncbi:GNAT family N-acetyltransferase [bacterium]|nr:GNAT family N-acetyltransferase [candidate division CSSED10-310 bacterium]
MNGIRIREYVDDDADGLMRMWQESVHLWPMGSPQPMHVPVKEFNRRLRGSGAIRHWVAEETGSNRIVGYCAFARDALNPEHMDVNLINTHPDWQGRGIGKALLIRCIDATASLGYLALKLGTWPGNEVACGLYKRIGFFHKPDTQIGFINFIPAVLQCPILTGCITPLSWYGALKRSTDYGPDEHRDGAMWIYPYHFETPSGPVDVGFERYSEKMYRIATPEIQICLKTDNDKGWRGFSRMFSVDVTRAADQHRSVPMRVTGCRGVEAEATVQMGGDESAFHGEYEARIPRDLQLPVELEPFVMLTVEHPSGSFEMGCGFHAGELIAAVFPEFTAFFPPGARRYLNLTNHVDQPVSAALTLRVTGDRRISPDTVTMTWDAGGSRAVPLTIDGEPGSAELIIEGKLTSGMTGSIPAQHIGIGLESPDRLTWIDTGEAIIAANAFYRLQLTRDRGLMILMNRDDMGCQMGMTAAEPGPPFANYGLSGTAEYDLIETPGGLQIQMTVSCRAIPGVRTIQTFGLTASPFVSVDAWLESEVAVSSDTLFRQRVCEMSNRAWTTIPAGNRVLRLNTLGPVKTENHLHHGDFLENEFWLALEGKNHVVGCYWPRRPPDVTFSTYFVATIAWPMVGLQPGGRIDADRIWFYTGPGDSSIVRRAWQRAGDQSPDSIRHRPMIGDLRDTVTIGPEDTEIRLRIDSLWKSSDACSLTIDALPAAGIDAAAWDIPDRSMERYHEVCFPIHRPDLLPRIEQMKGTIHTPVWDIPFSIPVIVAGKGNVRFERSRRGRYIVHTMTQGPLSVDLVPGFPSHVIATRWNGTECLDSRFPDSGVLGFEKPYYGGITPTLYTNRSGLTGWITGRGRRTGPIIERGMTWEGIRIDSHSSRRGPFQGLATSCTYLLSPDLPVLRCIMRVTNRAEAMTIAYVMTVVSPIMPPMDRPLTVRFRNNGVPGVFRRARIGSSFVFDKAIVLDYDGERPDFHMVIPSDSENRSFLIDTAEGFLYAYVVGNATLEPRGVMNVEWIIGFDDVGRGLDALLH